MDAKKWNHKSAKAQNRRYYYCAFVRSWFMQW